MILLRMLLLLPVLKGNSRFFIVMPTTLWTTRTRHVSTQRSSFIDKNAWLICQCFCMFERLQSLVRGCLQYYSYRYSVIVVNSSISSSSSRSSSNPSRHAVVAVCPHEWVNTVRVLIVAQFKQNELQLQTKRNTFSSHLKCSKIMFRCQISTGSLNFAVQLPWSFCHQSVTVSAALHTRRRPMTWDVDVPPPWRVDTRSIDTAEWGRGDLCTSTASLKSALFHRQPIIQSVSTLGST